MFEIGDKVKIKSSNLIGTISSIRENDDVDYKFQVKVKAKNSYFHCWCKEEGMELLKKDKLPLLNFTSYITIDDNQDFHVNFEVTINSDFEYDRSDIEMRLNEIVVKMIEYYEANNMSNE